MKRGSLQLSINAIVVLIMAIAMLGVGMFFIKNVVGGEAANIPKLTGDIKQQIKDDIMKTNAKLFISGLDGQTLHVPLKEPNDDMVVAVGNQEASDLTYKVLIGMQQVGKDASGNDLSASQVKAFFAGVEYSVAVNDVGFEPVSFGPIGSAQRTREVWKVVVCTDTSAGIVEPDDCSAPNIYDKKTFFVVTE